MLACDAICLTTAMATGSIIMVVAVLEIHIDKNAVATMNPRMILDGLVPMNRMITSAIRLWKFHFSMARAIMNPPMNRNTRWLV